MVLQTAVDEIAELLSLDSCLFLWYFADTRRVQVVCERNLHLGQSPQLGYYPLDSFGQMGAVIATGQLIVNGEGLGQGLEAISRISRLNKRTAIKKANHLFGCVSNLLVPITNEEERIGFVGCLSAKPRHWLAKEVDFLDAIVQPLEIAIRQAQLYEQTQKQAQREQIVNQITNQTRQSFDLEVILGEAIRRLLEAMEVDRCLVHLVEDGELSITRGDQTGNIRRQHLYEVCRPPFEPSIDEFDTHGPITQWVIQHKQKVLITDISQDERIGENNEEYQKAQIKSSLVVPVQANGKLYAILYLNQCDHVRYWSKNDQTLTQAVADQLAISIQQAYLYAQTRHQAALSAAQAQHMASMLEELKQTQAKLIQSEKMTSLGQMVAGVAHEINNPINFIYGNVPYLENYVQDLMALVQAYRQEYPQPSATIRQLLDAMDVDFLLRDLPLICQSMQAGAERVHGVVELLQNFSRQNEAPLKAVDLNAAIESTLLILHNQHSGRLTLERDWGVLPLVECYGKDINQVFLHLITNAIEALGRSEKPERLLRLKTSMLNPDTVQIVIADNGPGIQPEIISRVFDPFFTTKDVGQGRGIGLTVSYQIIVEQHYGHLSVSSQPGEGAEFTIELPVKHRKDSKDK